MTTLSQSFNRDLTEALLDDVEAELVGDFNPLIFETIQFSHDVLRDVADEEDWRVEPVIDSLQTPTVSRSSQTVTVRWGWDHPATPYFEYGTSDHTIEGNPVLSFVWEARHDPPAWVREEFDQARGGGGRFQSGWRVFLPEVHVEGVTETRFIRAGLERIRLALGGTVRR